jgi:hypothetical protein
LQIHSTAPFIPLKVFSHQQSREEICPKDTAKCPNKDTFRRPQYGEEADFAS